MKAKRIQAGVYEYSVGKFTVEVHSVPGNPAFGDPSEMWVAVAQWDNHCYSDPLYTKRDAVNSARAMLNEALGNE